MWCLAQGVETLVAGPAWVSGRGVPYPVSDKTVPRRSSCPGSFASVVKVLLLAGIVGCVVGLKLLH